MSGTIVQFVQILADLFGKYPNLVHNFPNSVFPAASFNCEPQTISLDHTDLTTCLMGSAPLLHWALTATR